MREIFCALFDDVANLLNNNLSNAFILQIPKDFELLPKLFSFLLLLATFVFEAADLQNMVYSIADHLKFIA